VAIASVTPRVRTIVVCDDVSVSPTEEGVFTLEGVRQHLRVPSFPWTASLNMFMLLSSPRKGTYSGKILVVNQQTEKPIRYVKFQAGFGEEHFLLPLYVEIGACVFPEAGRYSFEIYFSVRDGGEALKGEHPFAVVAEED
jgi:hypothetical protein